MKTISSNPLAIGNLSKEKLLTKVCMPNLWFQLSFHFNTYMTAVCLNMAFYQKCMKDYSRNPIVVK